MEEISTGHPPPPDLSYLTPHAADSEEIQTYLLNAKTTALNQYVQTSYNYIQPHLEFAKAIGGST